MRAILAMRMVWIILLHGASPNADYPFGATVLRFQARVWGTQLAISICSDCRAQLVSSVAGTHRRKRKDTVVLCTISMSLILLEALCISTLLLQRSGSSDLPSVKKTLGKCKPRKVTVTLKAVETRETAGSRERGLNPLPSLLKLRLCSLIGVMSCNSIPLFETKHKLAASG